MIELSDDTIVLVCAADDAFAMPLAAMIRSVLYNSSPEMRILLYVMDGGITKRNKRKILNSWDLNRITVEWLTPDLSILNDLKVSDHISVATYFRILVPDIIPERSQKAIYLDCDLIVMGDIGQLWDADFNGSYLLAVQDMSAPYMCSSTALRNYPLCAPYLSADTALTNYQELGLSAECKYFNGGVLVLNLEKWREDNISKAVIDYLEGNKEHVRWWDQDGLNAVLAGQWSELDLRWNQMPHIYRYPSWEESPFDEDVYNQVISNPYIIHFATGSKPWHHDCSHPARDLFFHYLDMTDWAGWRPKAPFKNVSREHLSKQKQLIRIKQRLKTTLREILPDTVFIKGQKIYSGILTKLSEILTLLF